MRCGPRLGSGQGSGGGGLFDFVTDLIPGSGNTTVAEDLSALIPGGGSSTGGITDFASQFVPGGGVTNDNSNNSFNLTMGDTKANATDVMDTVDNYYLSNQRSNLRNMPK